MQLEQNTELYCVEVLCYLGHMIEAGGGAGVASRVRVRYACKKFMELSNVNVNLFLRPNVISILI